MSIVAGLVIDMRRRGTRCSVMLDDNTERVEVTLFDEVLSSLQASGRQSMSCSSSRDSCVSIEFLNGWRVTAQRVRAADEVIEERARRLTIRWTQSGASRELVQRLKETLQPFRHGKCEVSIRYMGAGAVQLVTLRRQAGPCGRLASCASS